MPENLQAALDKLEEHNFSNYLCRSLNYTTIQNTLDKEEPISLANIRRLLAICVYDLKENIKHTTTILKILLTLLSKIKIGKYSPHPELLPSALAVIHLIKTTAMLSKMESLKELCCETLLSYPDETLIEAAECQEEVYEILNLYCHARIPSNIRLQTCSILHRLLKILPPEKKKNFVEKGLNVWFTKIIPSIMNNLLNEMTMEVLELLTEDILAFDYTETVQWHSVLESICVTTKYPAVLKTLLEEGSSLWSRLWIVFIKLLKHQVTQPRGSIGTPINSMLPVVENAFKFDVDNRCRAFDCWNVLIDSFSTETNENNINKRIKLLIIPLKSNNAKAEKTAFAKFKCWWHLLLKFHTKMSKFLDIILVSFLHFAFGKYDTFDKNMFVPGQISRAVSNYCIQAVVEIVGHVNCEGCTDLPKLTDKIINTKHLVDNWNHWIYSLTRTVMFTFNDDHGLTKQQMTCLWKSFLITIGELPENNIRKDLFSEMLLILIKLVQECNFCNKQREMVFNILFLSLFDKDPRIRQLLKTRCDVNDPLCKIVIMVLDKTLEPVYQRYSTTAIITYLRTLTDTILDPTICPSFVMISWILDKHSIGDIPLMLWAALAESICELKVDVPVPSLCRILVWPLEFRRINFNTEKYIKTAATKWQNLYDRFHSNLVNQELLSNEIIRLLSIPSKPDNSILHMKITITLCILKYKLKENYSKCAKEIEFLNELTIKMNVYEDFEDLFPLLVETVLLMINLTATNKNEAIASHVIVCVKKTIASLNNSSDERSEAFKLKYIGSLIKPLDLLFKVDAYSKLIPVVFDDLIDCTTLLSKQPATKSTIISLLVTVLSKMDESNQKYVQVQSFIQKMISDTNDSEPNADKSENVEEVKTDEVDFPAPKPVEVPQRVYRKRPSISRNTVEDGEEYLVVKSNWKFNPRKLTENQKEKFQRKREDIPALYQDLSQSQDEFKLASWKTESQDTSNSSRSESKSNTVDNNETATEMLKKLPSSDVVPKILKNFFSENDKAAKGNEKESTTNTGNSGSNTPKTNNNTSAIKATTPKNKTPRIALKDRVFRNVRNLIEKSGNVANSNIAVDLNKTENAIKTPTQTKVNNSADLVNSAPPMLSAHRPSRVKRKPKKFEELQAISAKRKKNTQDQNTDEDSQPEPEGVSFIKEIKTMEPVVVLTVAKELTKSIESDAVMVENQKPSRVDDATQSKVNSQNEKEDTNDKITKSHTEPIAVTDQVKHITVLDSDIITLDSQDSQNSQNSQDSQDSKDNNEKPEESNDKSSEKNAEMTIDENEKQSDKKESSPVKNKMSANVNTDENIIPENTIMDSKQNEKSSDRKKQDSPVNEISKTKEIANDKNDKNSDKNNQKSPVKENVDANVKAMEKPISAKETKSNDKDTSIEISSSPTKKEVSTPQQIKPKETEEQKSTAKKRVKKSRIEKELAIDMVEGNPFLDLKSPKRLTRKALEAVNVDRRKSLVNKLNKPKAGINNGDKKKRGKDKVKDSDSSASSTTVDDLDIDTSDPLSFSQEVPYSDDVIESSQDSSMTTISVRSAKKTPKKIPVVTLEKMDLTEKLADVNESQSILDCIVVGVTKQPEPNNQESRDDIELPLNKTAEEKSQDDLTENMDTEPINDKTFSDVIIVNDDPSPLTISDETVVGPETQEIAEADTQPTDPKDFMDPDATLDETSKSITADKSIPNKTENITESTTKDRSVSREILSTNDLTITLTDPVCIDSDKDTASSPASFREEAQRKKDFLNNTLEISPIKNMSPDRNKKSPSPETSNDYVVIKLTSPVHSNGEPYEKCSSPEVFTDDKGSPDKRDQSPPRVEVTVTSTSPSSSLSLKKNRPQVRSGGRGAQMLGLCVPDKVQAIVNPDKSETEENKKTNNSSTPVRRNLKALYNSVSDNVEATSENDESETFLKFSRSLPPVDSSPSCPILKRKHIEINDDGTVSPASKRKRVSFHDPPVSTTISVQKYIEPGTMRSPQNSVQKRMERQLRQFLPRSPKRLEHAFGPKLDTVLTRTVESFDTGLVPMPDDTQQSSLDETPVVEIVRASELNDTYPICPELLDCKDSIANIACQLSSSGMKALLVKELVGRIETVGDLAKLTELEVNRLCIKAPKVQIARKVLYDYVAKKLEKPVEISPAVASEFDEPMTETEVNRSHTEVQTDVHVCADVEMQTVTVATSAICAQTDATPIANTSAQTDESGSKSTSEIVKSCLAERQDFVEQVGEQLEESSIQQLTDKLSFSAVTDVLMRKVTPSDCKTVLNRILEHQCTNNNANKISNELSFIRDYMCGRFESKELVLFCSEVLKSLYDKPA